MPAEFRISRRKALALAGLGLSFSPWSRADSTEPAPRFSGKTLAGEAFNNQSLMGKVVLVEFWATWCPYCKRDAQPLDALAQEFGKDGLVVLAVDVGEPKRKVKAFLAENPRNAKVVLMEDTNLAAVFEAKSFPQYVLIQRDGRVGGQQRGSGGEAALRRLLRQGGLGARNEDETPLELQSSPRPGA